MSLFLVAGYTGYIPSDMNIAVPNKGHTTHLGRDAGVDVMEKIAMETTLSRVPTSSNKAQFPVYSKNDFKVPDGTNGGYWVGDRRKVAGAKQPTKRFIARSSYSHDVCDPREAAGVTLARQSMKPVAKPGSSASARFDGTSSQVTHYGTYGSNPLDRGATGTMGIGAGITQRSSTNELGMGTTRVTRHVPGYSGFIAEAPHNMDALSASDGVAVRPDEKKTMLLASVDQYSRDVVPGYTGWRPQEPVNFRQFPSAIAPTRRNTTNGELNYQLQRYPYGHMKAESMKPEVVGGDTRGVMGFFTPGKETESKEGIDAAGAFYAHARPYEGLAAGTPYTPSRTTQRGTKFTY